jgi:hypothetical protein
MTKKLETISIAKVFNKQTEQRFFKKVGETQKCSVRMNENFSFGKR